MPSTLQCWRTSAGGHLGVADEAGAGEAALDLAGELDTGADEDGRLAETVVGELFLRHAGDLDVDVDAVEEGTAQAFLVAGDHAGEQVHSRTLSPRWPQGHPCR